MNPRKRHHQAGFAFDAPRLISSAGEKACDCRDSATAPAGPIGLGAALLTILSQFLAMLSVGSARSGATRLHVEPTLADKIAQREHLTAILLTIPSAGIAVLTYYGVSLPLTETGSTIVQKGQAVGFALTLGVLAWLGWFYLFGLIYRLTGARLRGALIAGGVMIGTIAAIDAPFNMLALAGGPAAQMSLVDMAHAYEVRRDGMMARATAARRLVPAIRVQAARFASLKAQEEKSGTFSGRAAPGKVSASFGQVADVLNGLADRLEAGLGKIAGLQERLGQSLASLKGFAYRSGPIRERMQGASSEGDRIDAMLTEAGQYDPAASVKATLGSLDASLLRPTAGKGAFAQTQAAEIGAIAAMVKPVASALRDGLASLHGPDGPVLESRRPESPLTAIRTYWRALLPHWCAAVFIDLAPAALLLILIAACREPDLAEAIKPRGAAPFSQA